MVKPHEQDPIGSSFLINSKQMVSASPHPLCDSNVAVFQPTAFILCRPIGGQAAGAARCGKPGWPAWEPHGYRGDGLWPGKRQPAQLHRFTGGRSQGAGGDLMMMMTIKTTIMMMMMRLIPTGVVWGTVFSVFQPAEQQSQQRPQSLESVSRHTYTCMHTLWSKKQRSNSLILPKSDIYCYRTY